MPGYKFKSIKKNVAVFPSRLGHDSDIITTL